MVAAAVEGDGGAPVLPRVCAAVGDGIPSGECFASENTFCNRSSACFTCDCSVRLAGSDREPVPSDGVKEVAIGGGSSMAPRVITA